MIEFSMREVQASHAAFAINGFALEVGMERRTSD
jgi:hypothetical protein